MVTDFGITHIDQTWLEESSDEGKWGLTDIGLTHIDQTRLAPTSITLIKEESSDDGKW